MKVEKTTLWNLGIGLLIIGLGGCSAVYCANSYGENPWYFAGRQLLWLFSGIMVFLLIAQIPFRYFRKSAVWIAGIFSGILLLTALFGVSVNGMNGWLPVPGTSIRFQPSELAKAPFLLALCVIGVKEDWLEWKRYLSSFCLTALYCFLILAQPDFGTATVYAVIFPVMLFCGGFRKRYVLPTLTGWIFPAILFLLLHPYACRRIHAFLNPGSDSYGAGWHIYQFRYTMANGGWFGSETTGALWANTYLPYSYSDSIFATLVEASGFFGGMLVLSGFLVMLVLFRRAALESVKKDAGLYLFCVGGILAFQAFLHIGVNTTLLPPTGLPLPFFSYGGSDLVGVMLLLGTACSAYRESLKTKIYPETVQEHQQNDNRGEVPDQNCP